MKQKWPKREQLKWKQGCHCHYPKARQRRGSFAAALAIPIPRTTQVEQSQGRL